MIHIIAGALLAKKTMCRVLKVEIRETQDELQELLRQQKTGLGKELGQTH
jgi:hypothetical protein